MDRIIINNTSRTDDDKYKVSFMATFTDDTYVSGHIFLERTEAENMTMNDMRRAVCQRLNANTEVE